MIKTNTPEYVSLQNMIKMYAKVLCDNINLSNVGKKSIVVDLSDSKIAVTTYRNFKYEGDKLRVELARMFRKYVESYGLKGDDLDQYRLTDTKKFIAFFTNPFTLGLLTDYMEENYRDCTLKVKLPKDTEQNVASIIKAHKYFKSNNKPITWCDPDLVGLNNLIESLENPEDIKKFWMCRTMHGNAPVMIVENSTYNNDGTPNWSDTAESNHLKTIYAAYTKTKYIDARPCSYEYWNENEDVRFSTTE